VEVRADSGTGNSIVSSCSTASLSMAGVLKTKAPGLRG